MTEEMNNRHPLVSIIVVTYNAEKTVVETLDSAISQNYDNLEIIISDDSSKDHTVSVIRTWLEEARKQFNGNITLLTSETNQGVCRNFNKAIKQSSGLYIKIIAGDDILFPNCCEDYVRFVTGNPLAQFVTSYVKVYNEEFKEDNCVYSSSNRRKMAIFDKPAEVQLKYMAYKIFVSAPTMFFSRELYDRVGGFDERYKYEDHPFYISILEAGEKIYLLPKETVGYRIHQSIFNSSSKLFNYQFTRYAKQFREERCYKYYGLRQKIAVKANFGLMTLIERLHLNKKCKLSYLYYDMLAGIIRKIGE